EGQAENQTDPVSDRVVAAQPDAGPGGGEVVPVRAELGEQATDAAGLPQRDDDQGNQAGADDEELHDLVVDGARQPAQQDVGEHEQRRHHDGDGERDPEQGLQDGGQRVQVHARDEYRGQDEDDGVDQVRLLVVAPQEVLGNAPDPRAVVERHHHDAEEHHRRHGADPVVMHDADAVLGTARGHAENLDGPEIRRDESNAGNPGWQRAPRKEEVGRGLYQPAQRDANADHEGKVDDQQRDIQAAERQRQPAR